jgi:hypothetical protein
LGSGFHRAAFAAFQPKLASFRNFKVRQPILTAASILRTMVYVGIQAAQINTGHIAASPPPKGWRSILTHERILRTSKCA